MKEADYLWAKSQPLKRANYVYPVPFQSRALVNREGIPERKRRIARATFEAYEEPAPRIAFDKFRRAVSQMSGLVEADAAKCGGVLILIGTRFSVSQLFAQLAEGDSVSDIAENFDLDKASLESLLHSLAVLFDCPVAK